MGGSTVYRSVLYYLIVYMSCIWNIFISRGSVLFRGHASKATCMPLVAGKQGMGWRGVGPILPGGSLTQVGTYTQPTINCICTRWAQ